MSSLAPARDGLPLAGSIRRAAAPATMLVVAAIAQPALAAQTVLNVGMAAIDATLIEGDLAESWKSSPDGKQWAFRLRKGVQCHHGYGEFTADDVVYLLARSADPERPAFSSDCTDFDKVEAVDKYTIRISLKNQVPSALGLRINYHGGNMVCKNAAEKLSEKFTQKPIGTGPSMFGAYKSEESVTLLANPKYCRGKPKLETILYRYLLSDASCDLAFTSGEIELTYGKQDQTWVERMKRVQQAIAYAIDRNQIVQFMGKDMARTAQSIVPIGYLGHSADVPLLPYDAEKAKALDRAERAASPSGEQLPQQLR